MGALEYQTVMPRLCCLPSPCLLLDKFSCHGMASESNFGLLWLAFAF